MSNLLAIGALLTVIAPAMVVAQVNRTDPARDILVTFSNDGANSASGGISEPYRKRKRYSMSDEARQHSARIGTDYALVEVDRWPIRSLSIFCFVYRVPADVNRESVVERLRADPRVESAQLVHSFTTQADPLTEYDDTYASLQRGLDVMGIFLAHQYSRGQGVRIAIIDGDADISHEDLEGRLSSTDLLADTDKSPNSTHGTAVASVIGANANNARGMVGIAPGSKMELYVACWAEQGAFGAVCDSFTLAKALDTLLNDPADILNMSLVGPYDPLLARLLKELERAGVIIVAAQASQERKNAGFPASFSGVIGVDSSDGRLSASRNISTGSLPPHRVYAPGDQIMVAVPDDGYDFRSGTSLSAAHVSGVIALLLAVSPNMPRDIVQRYLQESQHSTGSESPSVNACVVLQLADPSRECQAGAPPSIAKTAH
jgi:subtilisin family serine protease